jgi:hypothetical protein
MSTFELAAYPFDVARRKTLWLATRSALLTRVLGRRDSRVAVLATVQIGVLFAFAVAAPVALFFVGPTVFGVAHLAADARYLVLRQRIPRGLIAVSVLAAVTIVALRALSVGHVLRIPVDAWEVSVGTVWILAALAFAARDPRSVLRLAWAGLFVALLAGLALTHVRATTLVLTHGHNLVAVGVWLVLYRRRRAWAAVPVLVLTLLGVAVLSGAVPFSRASAFGTHLASLGAGLAPGASLPIAARVVVLFVFLQGVHYATWLGWIPQDDLRTEGTPTFRMTARGLVSDFGVAGVTLVVVVALGLALLGLFRAHEALTTYLTLARFHGWLELAMLAFLFVGRRPAPRPA